MGKHAKTAELGLWKGGGERERKNEFLRGSRSYKELE
jgi:hypothetical protein